MPLTRNRFATFVARIRVPLVAIAALTILLGVLMGMRGRAVRVWSGFGVENGESW